MSKTNTKKTRFQWKWSLLLVFLLGGAHIARAIGGAPTVSTNSVSNVCPATTVNLNNYVTNSPPYGYHIEWYVYNGSGYSQTISNPTAVGAGTYGACYTNSSGTSSTPICSPITVTINSCSSTPSYIPSPTVSTNSVSNVCPATTVNLNNYVTNSPPYGYHIEWLVYTSGYGYSQVVSNPTAVGAGTYGANYINSSGTSASTICNPITVTINNCATTPSAPSIATSGSNSCPTTTVNLNNYVYSSTPSGYYLQWYQYTNGSLQAVISSSVSSSGTYYAQYLSSMGGASSNYSNAISITINSCSSTPTTIPSPTVSTNSVSNVCPATTVNLNDYVTNSPPYGYHIEWLVYTSGYGYSQVVSNPTAVGAGTYGANYINSSGTIASTICNPITVTINNCATTPSAPSIAASGSNSCPTTTVNLNNYVYSNTPSGYYLQWYQYTNGSLQALISSSVSSSGTYYAQYLSSMGGASSNYSNAISITINTCTTGCSVPNYPPTLSAYSISNSCPATTVNLNSLIVGTVPSGVTVRWVNSSYQWYNTPTAAPAGYYYAVFYDAVNNCSTPFSSCTPVVVTINPCSAYTISGNVWHDVNGGNVNNSYGTLGIPSGIYAVLQNTSYQIIASTMVNAGTGYYEFTNIPAGTYSVQIQTTAPGATGTVAAWPVSAPSGWKFTGEYYGTPNTGNDGSINGWCESNITVSGNVSNVNFGIQQIPTAGTTTLSAQANPGGTVNVSVPAGSFSGTDDGTATGNGINNIRITSFPANATSITINGTTYTSGTFPSGGVQIPANSNGQPQQAVSIDPVNGAVSVSIPYQTIDITGAVSNAGVVNVPFTVASTYTISGNVWHDVNGGNVNNSYGTLGIPSGIYAVLQNTSYQIIASTMVNAGTGYYEFTNIPAGTYSVQIQTTAPGATGTVAAWPVSAPSGWKFTGEYYGTPNTGNDGSINGRCEPNIAVSGNVSNVNFGIQQIPTAGTTTLSAQANPGGTVNVSVPAGSFSGTDDGTATGNGISNIRITGFPANATSITINGTTYTSGTFPSGGVQIPANSNGQPQQAVSIDPVDGAVTVSIPYQTIDITGAISNAGAVNVPFTVTSTVSISGNVYRDANGKTDNQVNGSGIGSVSGVQLYANLVSGNNTVVATVPVNSNGTYSFNNVTANTTYTVQLSTNQGVVGSTMPTTSLASEWVNTGEQLGTGSGNDGNVNSMLTVTVGTTNVGNANFGIEEKPEAIDVIMTSQLNPGGTARITVATLHGTDAEDGVYDGVSGTNTIKIITLPTNGTLYYNGSVVSSNQVITNYNPALLEFDPDNGDITASFTYAQRDEAKKWSAAATVRIPFGAQTGGQ